MIQGADKMNVVAVGAHQDDNELTCLGTLLRLKDQGAAITTVTVTDGAGGIEHNSSLTSAEVTATRNAEADEIAHRLGGQHICLNAPDEELMETVEVRTQLVEVFRAAGADLIFAPPPRDYHADHMVTSRLAHQACLQAVLSEVATRSPTLTRCPAMYYVEPVAGFGFQPTEFVDITDQFDEKLALLETYVSQIAALKDAYNIDLQDQVRTVNAFRGMQCGVRFAEAFQAVLDWPRVRAQRMLP
jgi:N-acetylglucosamine malate deacetylase 1